MPYDPEPKHRNSCHLNGSRPRLQTATTAAGAIGPLNPGEGKLTKLCLVAEVRLYSVPKPLGFSEGTASFLHSRDVLNSEVAQLQAGKQRRVIASDCRLKRGTAGQRDIHSAINKARDSREYALHLLGQGDSSRLLSISRIHQQGTMSRNWLRSRITASQQ